MFVSQQFGDDRFFQLVAGCKDNLQLVLPSIRTDITDQIIELRHEKAKVEILTGFDIVDYYHEKTDLNALRKYLDQGCSVHGIAGLRGSFCLFDSQHAMVQSGPITNEGDLVDKNYSVFIENQFVIRSLQQDYNTLRNDKNTRSIGHERINEIERAVAMLRGEDLSWKWNEPRTSSPIKLSGWTLEIFNCLVKIPKLEFELAEVYAFEPLLALKHPMNHHIKAKIRQQLQVLRDLKLLEFYARGRYRKLPGLMGL